MVEFVAVFPEIAVSHPGIPVIGLVTGSIDYLVARTGNRDPFVDGDIISAVEPALTVIEAKRHQTLHQISSAAQLIAQLICIQHKESKATYSPSLLTTNNPEECDLRRLEC